MTADLKDAKLPLLLLVGKNPDLKALFGPLFNAVAGTLGIYRQDLLNGWDPAISMKAGAIAREVSESELLESAKQWWGASCLNGRSYKILRIPVLQCQLLAIQENLPKENLNFDDASAYMPGFFPRTTLFVLDAADEALYEKLSRLLAVTHRGNRYTAAYARFRVEISSAKELTQLFGEIREIAGEEIGNKIIADSFYGPECEHGILTENFEWTEFGDIGQGRKFPSPCAQCAASLAEEYREKLRAEAEARATAEKAQKERQQIIQSQRASNGQCLMCGKSLNVLQRMLSAKQHKACTIFNENEHPR